jgi:hypothetical protein
MNISLPRHPKCCEFQWPQYFQSWQLPLSLMEAEESSDAPYVNARSSRSNLYCSIAERPVAILGARDANVSLTTTTTSKAT